MLFFTPMFPNEIMNSILAYNEEDGLNHRAVCREWRLLIDCKYKTKLAPYPLDVPLNKVVYTYVKLKLLVPLFFDALWKHSDCERNIPYNPLRVLKKGHDEKAVNLADLLNLDEIRQKGEKKLDLVLPKKVDPLIMPLISQTLVMRIDRLFGKEEPVFTKIVGTIFCPLQDNFLPKNLEKAFVTASPINFLLPDEFSKPWLQELPFHATAVVLLIIFSAMQRSNIDG